MTAQPLRRAAALALGVSAAVGAATAFYAIAVERRAFGIRFETLPILPAGARPIAVLHLADIHMAPWQSRKVEWIQGLRDLEPDLVVNTGDSLGHADGMRALAEALAPFAGVPGVYVHGSNDYYGPSLKNPLRYLGFPKLGNDDPAELDIEVLERIYDSYGWVNLNNSAARMSLRGSELDLLGTNDAHIELADLGLTARAQAALPGESDAVVGITHAPYTSVLDGLAQLGADAILAGHTHGGQVRVPGGPALTTNSDLPVEHADGLTTWSAAGRSVPLQVSAGIGTSIVAPFRLGTPPEAVLLTLTSGR